MNVHELACGDRDQFSRAAKRGIMMDGANAGLSVLFAPDGRRLPSPTPNLLPLGNRSSHQASQ